MNILTIKQSFGLDIDTVFSFFSKPENLELITPDNLRFQILTSPPIIMNKGLLINYKIKISLIPIKWKTLISKFDPPNLFIDEQISGPYSKWHHTHCFTYKNNRTTVEDKVQYLVPFGFIGTVVNRFYIRKMLRSIFEYRFYTIAKIFKDKYPDAFVQSNNPIVLIK